MKSKNLKNIKLKISETDSRKDLKTTLLVGCSTILSGSMK